MFFKSESSQGDLNGFLDRGSALEGELRFEENFRVDGKITGSVVSEGALVIGEHGEVEGEVRVRRLFVAGLVRGVIVVTEQLQITPSGRVYAEITVPSLRIEDGATFEGRCTMSRGVSERKLSGAEDREAPGSGVRPSGQPAGEREAAVGPSRVRAMPARAEPGSS